MNRVVLRCDVGPVVGTGHVMRCLALAEGLLARGHEVVMVADLAAVPWARSQVERRGLRHLPPPTTEDEADLVAGLDPWLVVVDSYVLPGEVYAEMTAGEATVLTLVDGDPGDRSGHLLLDQNIGAEDDAWPVPAGAERLAGTRFALMRDDVLAHRPSTPRAESASAVPQVFGFFGGTDPFGAAPVAARMLAATGRPFEATLVVARADLGAEVENVPLGPGQRVTLTPPVDDLPRRVAESDVVMSAAGTSTWEVLCLGAAPAVLCVADNQALTYGRIVEADLAVGLGGLADRTGTPDPEAVAALSLLLSSPARRSELRRRGWARIDGRGRDRVIDACTRRHRRRHQLSP